MSLSNRSSANRVAYTSGPFFEITVRGAEFDWSEITALCGPGLALHIQNQQFAITQDDYDNVTLYGPSQYTLLYLIADFIDATTDGAVSLVKVYDCRYGVDRFFMQWTGTKPETQAPEVLSSITSALYRNPEHLTVSDYYVLVARGSDELYK